MLQKDAITDFFLGFIFIIIGCLMVFIPNGIFSLILTSLLCILLINGVFLFLRYHKHKNFGDLIFSLISLIFAIILLRHHLLPQWIIRTTFGAYCLMSTLASLIQMIINYLNKTRTSFFSLLLTFCYLILGLMLLFNPNFSSELLMCFLESIRLF